MSHEEMAEIVEEAELEAIRDESPYDQEVSELIKEYQLCEKFKVLPDSGGLNDQNPFWLECMQIIINEISEYEMDMSKRNS